MFRLAPLLTTAAAAVSDETSLMQGVKPQQVSAKEDKSKSVSNLLETAKTMLKNGATSDVVEFATDTLNEIMTEVLPAIEHSHASDQALIDSTHRGFQSAIDELVEGKRRIADLLAEERRLSAEHKECRGTGDESREGCTNEYCTCEDKRQCDYDLYDIWTRFVTEESILRDRSDEIEGHFCLPGANGTTEVFRDRSVVLFEPWLEQKPVVEGVEVEYDVKVEVCETLYQIMDAKTADCDAKQTALEQASCAYANEATTVYNNFAAFWTDQTNIYQALVDEVHCLEIDRWKEWRTLTSVQCLLRATNERNGRPCEEETDEAQEEIGNCERVQVDTDIEHIRINYPVIPPAPEPPHIPHAPCSSQYLAQEYDMLWDPPEPEFHSANSHCNPRQECVSCVTVPMNGLCGIYGAHSGPWVRFPQPEDECVQRVAGGGMAEVTRAQMEEGNFGGINNVGDSGHFQRSD
jgi:hypothetical protein